MGGYSWRDLEAEVEIDCGDLPANAIEILAAHVRMPEDLEICLTVKFTSTGYYDPGVWASLPENSEPETYEDEREITGMEVDGVALPKDAVASLEPFVSDKVDGVDLNFEQRERSYV